MLNIHGVCPSGVRTGHGRYAGGVGDRSGTGALALALALAFLAGRALVENDITEQRRVRVGRIT